MSYHDKIEGGFLAKGNNLLEFIKRIPVLFKETAKLIPHQNDFHIILCHNIFQPGFELVCIQGHGSNTLFIGKAEDIIH